MLTRAARGLDPIRALSLAATAIVLAVVGGIAIYLGLASIPAIRREGLALFTGTHWSYRRETFGAAAMIYGTGIVSAIAIAIAAPLGLACAIFTSEVCPQRLRLLAKVAIELLAGIPSVVYGLFGILVLRGVMARLLGTSGDSLLTAGVLLAIMVLPTMASLSDDALQSVPARVRDAARGLGLTRAETVLGTVLPQAFAGIVSALLLGLGRALGETIAVFLVVGRADNRWPASLASLAPVLDAGQTLTSKLGGAETNIAMGNALHTSALMALGLTLLLATFALATGAQLLRGRIGAHR
ncbi:MAG: phosphate ABC transporter permease subunit PstC [Acidobacteriota bacterium]